MKIVFRPEAIEELIEAVDWYEARSPGLERSCCAAWMPAWNGSPGNRSPIR